MDLFSGIVFLILFIILMIFVFSMGILSPYVGKKEIVSIIAIGFVIGAIGGYFFIYPIYQDSPYVCGTIGGLFTMDDESINLNIPSTSNLSDVTSKINSQPGVNSVATNGFELKTTSLTNNTKHVIENHLKNDPQIESYNVGNNYVSVNLKNDASSTVTLGSLVNWLSNQVGVGSEFAFVHIKLGVNANDVLKVKEYLKDNHYTVVSVEGPVQDTIHYTYNNLVPNYVVVIVTGIIGVIVAIMGIYVEPLTKFLGRFRRFSR